MPSDSAASRRLPLPARSASRIRSRSRSSREAASEAEAAHLLLTYPWPGNVRELDNLVQRALILVNGPVIRPEHIHFELATDTQAETRPSAPSPSLASSLNERERDLILGALRAGNGNRREAAESLGISARTLRYKLARLREAGIDVPAP